MSRLLTLEFIEWLALGASLALLLSYFVFLRVHLLRDPTYTVQRTNERIRTQWVQAVMQQNKDILAVQTLRNSTMAATFLASTSVVLVMGTLSRITSAETLDSSSGPKLLVLLFDLFIAFFGFAMSIRSYNHVGYMIGMPDAAERAGVSTAQVAWHLNRAAAYYSAGMRAFYFLIPIAFWFFGPWALVVSTMALIALLYSSDRAPKGTLPRNAPM